jgi:hypothetical protein
MDTTVNKEPVYKLHLHGQKEGDLQEKIGVSAEHPFWVKSKGWTAAEELKSGSAVQDVRGEWLQVVSFEPQSDEQTTYNLSVEGSHSFFVSDSQVWVHNGGCFRGSGPAPGIIEVVGGRSTKATERFLESGKSIEFAFDAKSERFVFGRSSRTGLNGSPHEQLARSIGANDSDVLGGMIFGKEGKIYLSDFSGHYWQNWTPTKAAQLKSILEGRLGFGSVFIPF